MNKPPSSKLDGVRAMREAAHKKTKTPKAPKQKKNRHGTSIPAADGGR